MKFYSYYPGGNPTLLVENIQNQLTESQKIDISQKALESKKYDQVGFIQKNKDGLFKCQMMGNELCINALRSVGAWVNTKTVQSNFLLASSGTNEKFKILVSNQNVKIKFNPKYKLNKISKKINLVELDGIAHFTIDSNEGYTIEELTKKLKQLVLKNPKTENYPAVGLISYKTINSSKIKIQPLVYVKATNSYIFESACGSGSIAVLLSSNKSTLKVIQPSNQSYTLKKSQTSISLSGKVKRLEQL